MVDTIENPIASEDIPPFNPDAAMDNYKKESELSFKKHVADQIRVAYPEVAKAKFDDDKAIEALRRLETPDTSPEDFHKALEIKFKDPNYKPTWKPPKAPSWLQKNVTGAAADIGNTAYGLLQPVSDISK